MDTHRTVRLSRWTSVFTALCLAVALAGCSHDSASRNPAGSTPDIPAGQVAGSVTLEGRPFAGHALLSLNHPEAGTQTTQSQSGGRFLFPAVQPGNCLLRIVPPAGYQLARNSRNDVGVDVVSGRAADVAFTLTQASGVPGDSLPAGPGAWLRGHIQSESVPVAGVQVEFTPQSGGDRLIAFSDAEGNLGIFLAPGSYTITASTVATAMPWFTVASITPSTVTIVEGRQDTPLVSVTLARNPDVPLPKSKLSVWIGQDSTASHSAPPELPPVVVKVFRTGTQDLIVEGTAGTSHTATFDLDAGVYDISIEVPAGYELAMNWENPIRNVQLAPLGQSWAGFFLQLAQ
jgi:hypothetical protein